MGVSDGVSRRKWESRPDVQSGRLEMPKLAGLGHDLDSVEARRLQLWGQRILADISAWRHRQMRRREGVGS